MSAGSIDRKRGERLHRAMIARDQRKMMALAAELNISPAAVSKWKQGHAMSIDHACRLSDILEVSLDWLLMGKDADERPQVKWKLSHPEIDLVENLRSRPARITQLVAALISEIPQLGNRR